MKTPEERIHQYIEKTGTRDPETIRLSLKTQKEGPIPMSIIRKTLAGLDPTQEPEATPLGADCKNRLQIGTRAFSLSSMRVATIKPKEGLKAKLFRLKRNTGYPLEELADEWGVSSDTLRRDAKRLDALLYVETAPGEWVQCVVHPDTSNDRKARTI